MSRKPSDYVALTIISKVEWGGDSDPFQVADFDSKSGYTISWSDSSFSGDIEQLKKYTEGRCGFPISDVLLSEVMRSLADCGLIRVTDDNYSGTFVKLKPSEFQKFIERAHNERAEAVKENEESAILTRPSDYPSASALMAHELFEDYHELGDDWLRRALEGLKRKIEMEGKFPTSDDDILNSESIGIPASDRLVKLSDNQQIDLETSATELIEIVEKQNGVDGDQTIKQQIVGQLKAGRELVRAGVFKLALMEQTIISVLGGLIEKYKNQAIGHAAKKLLDLLIEYVVRK